MSHRTRIGVAALAIVAFSATVFFASLLILPRYVTATVEHDVEEWSPSPMDTPGAVLTSTGMAAAAVVPTERREATHRAP